MFEFENKISLSASCILCQSACLIQNAVAFLMCILIARELSAQEFHH